MKITITDLVVLLIIVCGVTALLLIFLPTQSPEPMFDVGTPVCPDLEGGNYWVIRIDNTSTPIDENFTLWEGHEGELMEANYFYITSNNTYKVTFVGSNETKETRT